jgi:hypothetical protein
LSSCNNLDEPASDRCHEHTEALVEEATLSDLWDRYGIVGDLVVSSILICSMCYTSNTFSHLQTTSLEQTFMSLLPLTFYTS